MDPPHPRTLSEQIDSIMQAMRVLLHQLWIHPLIMLFHIYVLLGYLYIICRPFMTKSELTLDLDLKFYQFSMFPLTFIVISHFVGGVEFDIMYINGLIETAWEVLLRRTKHGLRKFRECFKHDFWKARLC